MAPSKAKRITIKPAGISHIYVPCPSCPTIRPESKTDPSERGLVPEGETHCRYCRGRLIGNELRKKYGKNSRKKFHGAKLKPVAKAKAKR